MKNIIASFILFSSSYSLVFAQIEKPKPKPKPTVETSPKPVATTTPPVAKPTDVKPKIQNGWTEENLKGKVKSTYTRTYTASDHFGVIQKDTLTQITKVSFSANGFHVEQRDSSFEGGQFSGTSLKEYDAKGNKINSTWYDSIGNIGGKTVYKYDEQNHLIEERNYGKDGTLFGKTSSSNDINGNSVEKTKYLVDGKIASIRRSRYNENNQLIEQTYYKGSETSPSKKWYFKYNSNGDQIENIYFKTPTEILSNEGHKITAEYFYDKHGNWIKYVTYFYDGSIYVDEREIVYY